MRLWLDRGTIIGGQDYGEIVGQGYFWIDGPARTLKAVVDGSCLPQVVVAHLPHRFSLSGSSADVI